MEQNKEIDIEKYLEQRQAYFAGFEAGVKEALRFSTINLGMLIVLCIILAVSLFILHF